MKPTIFRCRSAKTVALYVFHAVLAALAIAGTVICSVLLSRFPTDDPYAVIVFSGIWLFPLLIGSFGGVIVLIAAIALIVCSAVRRIVFFDTYLHVSADPLTAKRVQHALTVSYDEITTVHPTTIRTDTKGNALRSPRSIPCLTLRNADGESVGIISLRDYSPAQHTAILDELARRLHANAAP